VKPTTIVNRADRRRAGVSTRLTIVVGFTFAVLFVVAYLLAASGPGPGASDQQLQDFYDSSASRTVVISGLYVMPFSGIAFIWFIVALRMWISEHADHDEVMLSNVQLVTGIVFTGLYFVAAAAGSSGAAGIEFSGAPVDASTLRAVPTFGSTVMFVFAIRMAAMFVFTTTAIGRRAGILPRWFVALGLLVGLFLLFTAKFSDWFALVFPGWVAILCVLLAVRLRHLTVAAKTA